MFGWLFPSSAERRLIPGGRLKGATPYVIAIMTFVMLIVAAAGLALSNAAAVVTSGIENRYAIQLPGGRDALDRALRLLSTMEGISGVQPVPEQEMRDTLERWLGPASAQADLPVPGLINFELEPSADFSTVAAQIERAIPGGRVSAHEQALQPLLRSLRMLQWLALALVLLMAGAASATVVLAARGALDTHRSTVEVMHGIGATDLQVTHLFQRKIALDALAGCAAGTAGAGLVLALVLGGQAAFAADFSGRPALGTTDLLILLLLPLMLVIVATWVARSAVLAALREAA